jgi:CheY-like chemotaxis protein
MPDMTGLKLAIRIITIRPDIPVILCAGFSKLIDGKQAKTAWIRGFLMKPFVTGNLAKIIRKVLDDK